MKRMGAALLTAVFCFALNASAQAYSDGGYYLDENYSIQPGPDSPLGNYVIQRGSNRGKRLTDVVESYRMGGIQIPVRAIEDSFAFYDRYRNTVRQYDYTGTYFYPDQGLFSLTDTILTATNPSIANQRYLVIFDLDKNWNQQRVHLIDLLTGEIRSSVGGHGKASDCPDHTACRFVGFMNPGSASSPLGFFSTGPQAFAAPPEQDESSREIITLHGMERATPGVFGGNAGPTKIVIHTAGYVSKVHAGRSKGCLAMNMDTFDQWKNDLKGGALIYFYSKQLDSMRRDPNDLSGLMDGEAADGLSRDPARVKKLGGSSHVPAK